MNNSVSTWPQRAAAALLFTIGGAVLILLSFVSMLAGASAWYFLCFCAQPIIGILWLWRPRVAAALSIGPLIAVAAALLQYASGIWLASRLLAVGLTIGLTAASMFVAATLRRTAGWQLPLLISLLFVTCAFAAARLFTNKVKVQTYQMQVGVDGDVPWGDVVRVLPPGPWPIVLYRRVGDYYCYDAFKSKELRQWLAQKNGRTVTVEFNIVSDFGNQRSYHMRSVDGLLLSNLRGYEIVPGEVHANGIPTATIDDCR